MADENRSPCACGQLEGTFSPEKLGSLLAAQGLNVQTNRYSVRVTDCSHFKFEIFNGDVAVDADADSVQEMLTNTGRVSAALTGAGIRHRFEVYDHHDTQAGYFHFEWPQNPERPGVSRS